ncbi:MAG: hypothetical protein BroJett033_7360 [Chloroflexota bacterium]|nr:MAG: hypothetical protein BroJett033_7360 [Chloroflexota bacterium]
MQAVIVHAARSNARVGFVVSGGIASRLTSGYTTGVVTGKVRLPHAVCRLLCLLSLSAVRTDSGCLGRGAGAISIPRRQNRNFCEPQETSLRLFLLLPARSRSGLSG